MSKISNNGIKVIASFLLLTLITSACVILVFVETDSPIYDILGSWITSIAFGSILVAYTPLKNKILTKKVGADE